jgi:tRNA1Val (adenine37-N6)-methyltransferase
VRESSGIVRPARRPVGWRAPGPAPRARGDVVPGPFEDLCYLSGDWRILQRVDGHRWSLDDLVTAWFATTQTANTPTHVLDLGCGIGSVLLMLAWRFPTARVTGIEAQAVSVDLARRSIAWNGVEDRCRVHLGDLRDAVLLDASGRADLVTGTPPYLAPGEAPESQRVQKGPCNFEHRGGLEAYCAAAGRVLGPDGVFVACAQASQRVRMHAAAAAAGLGVTHELPVVPRAGKPPLFAVFTMRPAPAAQALRVLPALVVRDERGARTAACRALRADMGLPP